jgi:hypothetical protein
MDPIVQIGRPEKRSGMWAVQARVNLHGAWISVTVEAPEKLAAQALARWQALKSSELALRVKRALAPVPNGRGAVGAMGADEIWASLRAQAGGALDHPVMQGVALRAMQLVPRLGSSLGQMPPQALDGAVEALRRVRDGNEATAEAIRTNYARAQSGDSAARSVNALLCAAVLAIDAPDVRQSLCGLLAAGVTVAGVLAGEGAARSRILSIAAQAQKGARGALEALGYLGAVEQALDPTAATQLFSPAAISADDAARIERDAVGALLAPRQAALVAQLGRLARARAGQYRRAA